MSDGAGQVGRAGVEADRRFMALALALAQRGLGNVWPNPAVGCVIVAGDRIVGRGWTRPGGRPHAEVVALAQAGGAARGATAYVTLEPCAHHGRTPPCAEALIAAGVGRVVSALTDPDPRVSGRGHALLQAAGVQVEVGLMAAAAAEANAGFLSRIGRGRPMLTLKLATTLDGRIATASGESRWITGPEARRHVHALRLSQDAVLVGSGTARADDPDLTVRGLGAGHQPVRVVIDSRLSLALDGRLARSARDLPLWLCHGPDVAPDLCARWQEAGARLIACSGDADGRVDPRDALARLGAAGLTRVLCEGGGRLAAALLRAGLPDRLYLYTAGRVIGAEGRAAIGDMGLTRLPQGLPEFRLTGEERLGQDLLSRWQRR